MNSLSRIWLNCALMLTYRLLTIKDKISGRNIKHSVYGNVEANIIGKNLNAYLSTVQETKLECLKVLFGCCSSEISK